MRWPYGFPCPCGRLSSGSMFNLMNIFIDLWIDHPCKTLARTEPQRPASTELSDYEIKAVCALKRRYGRVRVAARSLTIGQAVTHIAEIGGYTGKSSGGPPGSTTIGRGLERVQLVAEGMKLADEARVTSWNKRVNFCRSPRHHQPHGSPKSNTKGSPA